MTNKLAPAPRHIGIIMDGNRRWAKASGKTTVEGHKEGYIALKNLLETFQALETEYLTIYAFSSENWSREKTEVDGIMKLLTWVLKNEIDSFSKLDISLKVLGSRKGINESILKLIDNAEEKTKNGKSGTIGICFNYGGRQEIIDAVNTTDGEITEEKLSQNMYHADFPDIDLVIRTSGEQRLSNFMLWRAAYAEFYFTDVLWPDFSRNDLLKAVDEYNRRQRRYGS